MGLLNGGLQAIFGAALGPLYLDGQLIRVETIYATDGTLTKVTTAEAIKVQIDAVTEQMRQSPGYTERDIRLIILQSGILGRAPSSDDYVTIPNRGRWSLASVDTDVALVYWQARATPATLRIELRGRASLMLTTSLTVSQDVPTPLMVYGRSTLAMNASARIEVEGAPPLPAGARIYVNAMDLASTGGRYLPNRMQPERAPSDNILAFSKGRIYNESGSGTTNHFYQGCTDPDGGNNGVRFLLAANGSFYYHRSSVNAAKPPNGTTSLSVWVRAAPATGPHANVRLMIGNTLNTGVTVGDTWVELTHEAAYTGAGDTGIRAGAAGADLVQFEPYWHQGTLVTMPPRAERGEHTGLRPSFSFDGAMPVDAEGLWDTNGLAAGGILFDPDYPNAHAYNEITTIIVDAPEALDTTSYGVGFSAEFDTTVSPSTSATTYQIGVEAPAETLVGGVPTPLQYAGWLKTLPLGVRNNVGYNRLGQGANIIVNRAKSQDMTTFVQEIPVDAANDNMDNGSGVQMVTVPAFSGFSARQFRVASYNSTLTSERRSFRQYGKYFAIVVYDRFLSDAEVRQAVAHLRFQLSLHSVTTAPLTKVIIGEQDSNTEDFSGYFMKMAEASRFEPNLLCLNTAWGGSKLFDDTNGPSWLNRYTWRLQPKIQGALFNGREPWVSMNCGTNDSPEIATDPMGWYAKLKTAWAMIRADGAKLMAWTLPLGPTTVGYEAARQLISAQIRLDSHLYDHLIDIAADPNFADTPYNRTTLMDNTVHYNAAGDTILADNHMQPALIAVGF